MIQKKMDKDSLVGGGSKAAQHQEPAEKRSRKRDVEEQDENGSQKRKATAPMSADSKTLAAKLQAAVRGKKDCLTVMASSEGLLKRIEEKDEWAWARSALLMGKLQQLKSACEDSVTEWGRNCSSMRLRRSS